MKQSILSIVLTCILTLHVTAFPHLNGKALQDLFKRGSDPSGRSFVHDNSYKSEKRAVGFDPVAQRVSTIGQHAFVPPNLAAGDKRGPCPGLNALANHGYLPHNGIAPATTIIQAVVQGQSMLDPANNDALL